MDPVILSRWQFALTTIYHFFFVPLTLGLGWFVAIWETIYVRTGDETYKRFLPDRVTHTDPPDNLR